MLKNTAENKKKSANTAFVPLLILLILVLSGAAYYFYFQLAKAKQDIAKLKQDPQKIAQEETKNLIARVSQLIVLPEGEDPTVATVSDPEKLRDQPFFAKAKKGDNVLIYTNAKKAILYDPVNNKIVEVAPLNIGAAGQETQGAVSKTPVSSTSPSPTASPAAKKK